MKKIIIPSILSLLILNSCFLFNYNSEATVIVRNIGELTFRAEMEGTIVPVHPGGEEEFSLTWPGKDDMHINLWTFITGFEDVNKYEHFWIANGETKTFEFAFYLSDIIPEE